MTENDRFDEVLDRDWNRFGENLADRIVALAGTGSIGISMDTAHGPATYARIQPMPDGRVQVAVAGADTVTRSVAHADELARHVVSVLRGHRNVVHPIFLHTDDALADGALRDRVKDTLSRRLGRPAPVDADGDFVLVLDSHAVFVVVDRPAHRVQLWAPLLHGIAERSGAADALVDLNRDWPHIKVVLVEDRLVATVDMLGDPFVPRHLNDLLEMLKVFLGTVDARFARRFDGMRYIGEVDSDLMDPDLMDPDLMDPDVIDPDIEETVLDEPPS